MYWRCGGQNARLHKSMTSTINVGLIYSSENFFSVCTCTALGALDVLLSTAQGLMARITQAERDGLIVCVDVSFFFPEWMHAVGEVFFNVCAYRSAAKYYLLLSFNHQDLNCVLSSVQMKRHKNAMNGWVLMCRAHVWRQNVNRSCTGSATHSWCNCSYLGSVDKLTPNRLGVRLYTEPGYEQ